MDRNDFKIKAEGLLEKFDKTLAIDELSNREEKCYLERDILVRFTELVHAFDPNHPLKKVLYDTISYGFTNSFCLNEQELKTLRYCIESFIEYLDDFVK